MNSAHFNRLLKTLKDNKTAFEELYTFYFPKIVAFVRYQYQNKLSAEDIAQDFFVYLLQRQEPFPQIKNPTAWVFQICKNIAFKEYERTNAIQPLEEEASGGFESAILNTTELEQALSKLDKQTEEIIRMHVYLGYKLKEIAIQIGENYSTVRNKYNRGIKELAKILKNFE